MSVTAPAITPAHTDLTDAVAPLRYATLLKGEQRAIAAVESADPDPHLGDRIVSLIHMRRIGLVTTPQIISALRKLARWRVAEFTLITDGGDVKAIVLPWARRGELPFVLERITGVRLIEPCEVGHVLSGRPMRRRATA